MPYGYTGKVLVADLTTGTVTVDEHDDACYRKYMGGAALAMDYILREVPPKADPLGPDNVLVFAVGPLTGTADLRAEPDERQRQEPAHRRDRRCPGGRLLPGRAEDRRVRRRRGQGQVAARPVYLWIKDGEDELRDASPVLGHGHRRVRGHDQGRARRQQAADS